MSRRGTLYDNDLCYTSIAKFDADLATEQIDERQMVVGRYRILFTIKGRNVHVLHVRGAYVADSP